MADGGSHAVHYGWDYTITTGGVCSDDNVTPCTIANESSDCGSGNTCSIASQIPWHPVKGSFEIAFYALAANSSAGTPAVEVSLVRVPSGVKVSHTFTLTNDSAWHQYVYTFTGTDTDTSVGNLIFTLTGTNGSAETSATIYIDDIYLGKTENSTTGFRDEVINTLKAINPGSLRYLTYLSLLTNDAGLEGKSGCTPGQGAPDTPGTCDFQHGAHYMNGTNAGEWLFSAADMYPLANAVGAVPWINIDHTFSDADLITFTNNLCAAFSTYNFASAWIEDGNEEWNGGGSGGKYGSANLGKLGYGEEAQRNFSIISSQAASQCPSYASRFHYIMGNQVCNSGIIYGEMQGAAAAGYAMPNTSQYGTADATYYGVSSSESGNLAAQAAAYAEAYFSLVPTLVGQPGTGCINNGTIYSDYGTVGSNNFVAFYETGPGAFNGASTEQLYLSEAGFPSAAWMAASWLQGQALARTPIQNEYDFAQVEFGVGGIGAPIWGMIHDLDSDFGPAFPHLRPIAMAEQVVNSAIGGAYYQVKAPSGTVINAYQNAGAWSAALVNTTASPITLTLEFPSSGTMPQTAEAVLNTNGITDNAENSNDVYVGALPGGLNTSGQNVTLTLPPFSVVAIH